MKHIYLALLFAAQAHAVEFSVGTTSTATPEVKPAFGKWRPYVGATADRDWTSISNDQGSDEYSTYLGLDRKLANQRKVGVRLTGSYEQMFGSERLRKKDRVYFDDLMLRYVDKSLADLSEQFGITFQHRLLLPTSPVSKERHMYGRYKGYYTLQSNFTPSTGGILEFIPSVFFSEGNEYRDARGKLKAPPAYQAEVIGHVSQHIWRQWFFVPAVGWDKRGYRTLNGERAIEENFNLLVDLVGEWNSQNSLALELAAAYPAETFRFSNWTVWPKETTTLNIEWRMSL